jgi:2'-5' RNA ligase
MDVVNRTFVGIPLPRDLAESIHAGVMELRRKPGVDVRWSPPSEYLVQIASLGELSPATLNILRQSLPGAIGRFPRFRLTLEGYGGTPNLIQPRFAHVQLGGDVQFLEQIAQAVDQAVAPYVPGRDIRGFRPQIQLGRLKTESESLRVALGRALKLTAAPELPPLHVDSICLLTSRATESGVVYDVAAAMPLGA